MENKDWFEKMQNLLHRRSIGDIKKQPVIDDYKEHVAYAMASGWLKPKDVVLDVGCGEKRLMTALLEFGFDGEYNGIDPFPVDDTVSKICIEDGTLHRNFDTVMCFAVLDGVKDIEKTLSELNRISERSIIMLTGIGIKPDRCHTFEISLELLDAGLPDFKRSDKSKFLHPKVALLCYQRWR